MNMAKILMSDLLNPISEKELHELDEAERKEPFQDIDCPEMTVVQLQQFRRVKKGNSKHTVSLQLSRSTYEKAKAYGTGYAAFLSRLLDVAINDETLVRKCV